MQDIVDLAQLASQVMQQRGLEPEFSKEELLQLSHINDPAALSSDYTDLRSLLWCSIDNDDSRDLDQLTYAEKGGDGRTTLWVAVADVSALVDKDSPIDIHACTNTTSVYTPARIFSMLPEKLSTDLTSLNEGKDRAAIVVKMHLTQAGKIQQTEIFQAFVHNGAKLTYNAVGDWLEGKAALPEGVKKIPGLESSLRVQHEAAQLLRRGRYEAGSLTLVSSEAEVKIATDKKITIQLQAHNFAHQLIEEFMIAANRAMADHFNEAKLPNLRRVVRIPKYWDRIVAVAHEYGVELPADPDSKALDVFLVERQKADPVGFPDLCLTVIKLLGRGEYIVENDKDIPVGHFALALSDYTHSTAPNRRFPDLISQRQYKAFLRGEKPPYSIEELRRLAAHCSRQEDAAVKVQRQMNKSAAAMLLSTQIGKVFKGIVTGVGEKGTFVRIFQPAVEGKIIHGFDRLNIGDTITVQLKFVDILRGFIDFAAVGGK